MVTYISRLYYEVTGIKRLWFNFDKFSKMTYFIVMTEKIMAEELVRLFRDNIFD